MIISQLREKKLKLLAEKSVMLMYLVLPEVCLTITEDTETTTYPTMLKFSIQNITISFTKRTFDMTAAVWSHTRERERRMYG